MIKLDIQQVKQIYKDQAQDSLSHSQYLQKSQTEKKISLDTTKYNDDEPLQFQQEMVKQSDKTPLQIKQLTENINFNLISLTKCVKLNKKLSQTVPAMVSLKVNEINESKEQFEDDENCEVANEQIGDYSIQNIKLNAQEDALIKQKRPNIDLVCVIDISGSMKGQKIQQVKETLKLILQFLNENDRISLVQFDSQAQRILPFTKINILNIKFIEQQIESLEKRGGTDVKVGIQKGLRCLEERQYKNNVSSIFLLSDGQTQSKNECLNYCKNIGKNQDNIFTLHTFGFGNDHDPELMRDIATNNGGNFYYVSDIQQVDEMFASALGGLFSIVAQKTKITVNLPQFSKHQIFQDVKISKTYGEMWEKVENQYEINIKQLMQGISKDYVMEIEIPPLKCKLQDQDRNPILVEATLEIPEYSIKIKDILELTFYNEKESIPKEIKNKRDEEVEFNYLRVRGAEVIQNSMEQAEKGDFKIGQEMLKNMQKEIKSANQKTVQRLSILNQDIEDSIQSCSNKSKFNIIGKKIMINNINSHMLQQCKPQTVSQTFQLNEKKPITDKNYQSETYSNTLQCSLQLFIKSKKSKK